ncbi:type II secretion system minor pseudopilin GspH [Methylomonas rivi]|uniref:Type II secretion system protein H n=1 Tax=Methylomonas rivi TaxID=2952226 RepID=A0ABT1U4A6_9GAMM|nr:type II secretion system minor pseudopilin GspH [Methylomonas sp. WSC-6]MBS4050241.1 type II secretion system minor pseudopilin GspH [Methylomonas sp.]MCQ8128679.1 type II secretion system minor pseudopilin GspH [Methylomonas sp. WSC-6]
MRAGGFTLIELLIVLVLIGAMTGMAMLSIGNDGKDRRPRLEAERLETLLSLAEQETQLRGEAMALELFAHGYRFLILTEAGWREETGDAVFRARELDSDLRIGLLINGENRVLAARAGLSDAAPQILLAPDGDADAVRIDIGDRHGAVQIGNDGEEGWTVMAATAAP